MAKSAQRKAMKERLKAQTAGQARGANHQACTYLHNWPVFLKAKIIMVYLALPQEADPQEAAKAAQNQGKTLLVPSVDWEKRAITPVELDSGQVPMDRSRYGLRQPVGAKPCPMEAIDLVVVPGLAFDKQGNRLGRGGGFYDRFLSQYTGQTCGFAFGFQVLDACAVKSHDRPVSNLVTEKGFEALKPERGIPRP